jgi:hypothetical protein
VPYRKLPHVPWVPGLSLLRAQTIPRCQLPPTSSTSRVCVLGRPSSSINCAGCEVATCKLLHCTPVRFLTFVNRNVDSEIQAGAVLITLFACYDFVLHPRQPRQDTVDAVSCSLWPLVTLTDLLSPKRKKENAIVVRLVGVLGLARSLTEWTSAWCAEIHVATREFRRRVHDGCSKLSDSCVPSVCPTLLVTLPVRATVNATGKCFGLLSEHTAHVDWHASTPTRCLHAARCRIKQFCVSASYLPGTWTFLSWMVWQHDQPIRLSVQQPGRPNTRICTFLRWHHRDSLILVFLRDCAAVCLAGAVHQVLQNAE